MAGASRTHEDERVLGRSQMLDDSQSNTLMSLSIFCAWENQQRTDLGWSQ
jgi:hypothetical protein